ncbi:hypothetical protein [Collimonas antrihumi]|uniref:hypothetical protein n=1 Tax=Collimonas antrihumi TaxID=1940615 RepID=UPI001B8CFA15|nr:hypothetical protein [Collimonas antrihumi]
MAHSDIGGSYLHSFEDTFAHRDSNNHPFALDIGLGHGVYGSNPDYTYNHWSALPFPGALDWNHNEDRTLEMEKEVFNKLLTMTGSTDAKKFSDIEDTLKNFNKTPENEGDGYDRDKPTDSKKIQLLQGKLKELKIDGVNWTDQSMPLEGVYAVSDGADNRTKFLCDKDGNALNQKLYPGTILPKCEKTGGSGG